MQTLPKSDFTFRDFEIKNYFVSGCEEMSFLNIWRQNRTIITYSNYITKPPKTNLFAIEDRIFFTLLKQRLWGNYLLYVLNYFNLYASSIANSCTMMMHRLWRVSNPIEHSPTLASVRLVDEL